MLVPFHWITSLVQRAAETRLCGAKNCGDEIRIADDSCLWFWRGRRCELCEVTEPQLGFDAADFLLRVFEAVFAKHLVLDVLKLIGDLVELFVREILLPSGKHNRVFTRGMILIHQHKALEHFG